MLVCISTAFVSGMLAGCTNDVYNPDAAETLVPPADTYFSFNTKAPVTLKVDYAMPGMPTLIEVYDQKPVATDGNIRTLRQDLTPLFMAFTDENGRFEGKMEIPTRVEKIYLYTREMGYPECVEVDMADNAFVFDNSASAAEASTRAYGFTGTQPYRLDATAGLYSLCKWDKDGRVTSENPGYVTRNYWIPIWNDNGKTKNLEGLSVFTSRLKNLLWNKSQTKPGNLDNSALIGGVEQTNFYIAKETRVSLMFLHERAGYRNTFGYYYYKGSGERNVADRKKYVLFPNVSIVGDDPYYNSLIKGILQSGYEVTLKIFGENGDQPASDKFPVGYTIGWFMIPEGFNPNTAEMQNIGKMITSNDINQRFISVYDEKLRGVVVGAEDGGDKSYEDMLFCVFTDDMDAIIDPKNPGRPYIKESGTDIVIPDVTERTVGTLAFEDIWPSGGDYDMNDVVVEYERAVTFDSKNRVKKIADTFVAVHDGASYANAFAYQTDPVQTGVVTVTGDGAVMESETNSVVVFPNVKQAVPAGKTVMVERTFNEAGLFLKTDLKPINPYVIVKYTAGERKRVEVHLPKHQGTIWADNTLNYTADDAYYIDKGGKYPFAIELPLKGFHTVTERSRIDDEAEYPDFKTWVESKGLLNKDWYNNYKNNY